MNLIIAQNFLKKTFLTIPLGIRYGTMVPVGNMSQQMFNMDCMIVA